MSEVRIEPTRLLAEGRVRKVDTKHPAIRIEEGNKPGSAWAGKRLLTVDGARAFELSFWCGTCPFVFERIDGATRTLSVERLTETLNSGISGIDRDVVRTVSKLLPTGKYLPLLLQISPTLVHPGQPEDYFTHEQVATWGIDSAVGVPENPGTPYYRTPARQIDSENKLFEFVVPLVPPSWNDQARVEAHAAMLKESDTPTCLSLGVLDIRQQADWDTADGGLIHWTLAHYLLDGHHKIEAAARTGSKLQILSLVSINDSLASEDEVRRLPKLFDPSTLK